jgi:hypothetical protein
MQYIYFVAPNQCWQNTLFPSQTKGPKTASPWQETEVGLADVQFFYMDRLGKDKIMILHINFSQAAHKIKNIIPRTYPV